MTPRFALFSLTHFAAIFIVVILITMAILRLRKRAPSLNEERFNHWLAVLVISNDVLWKLMAIRGGYFTLDDDLPFHLCDISPYLIAAYLWKPRQPLFDILYYWALAGATLALIFPDLTAGYPSSEFSGFFITHGLPLFAILYLILVQGARPFTEKRDDRFHRPEPLCPLYRRTHLFTDRWELRLSPPRSARGFWPDQFTAPVALVHRGHRPVCPGAVSRHVSTLPPAGR